MKLRRVEAWVEVDGAWRIMVFITNNTSWSPRSVCDLYRRRWDIKASQIQGSGRAVPSLWDGSVVFARKNPDSLIPTS